MFSRTIIDKLKNWASSPNRKPLILRGARQVGKTTAVNLFSKEFDQFISLNLEIEEDAELFNNELPISELIQSIFLYKNISKRNGKLLIFIDEIQCLIQMTDVKQFDFRFHSMLSHPLSSGPPPIRGVHKGPIYEINRTYVK